MDNYNKLKSEILNQLINFDLDGKIFSEFKTTQDQVLTRNTMIYDSEYKTDNNYQLMAASFNCHKNTFNKKVDLRDIVDVLVYELYAELQFTYKYRVGSIIIKDIIICHRYFDDNRLMVKCKFDFIYNV